MVRSMPDGTTMRVGASASMRWRIAQSMPDFKASLNASSLKASSRVLPANAGFSHVSRCASSASSDRSGSDRSGIHTRRQRTRARHCASASRHGSASMPSARTASVSACAACAGSTRPAGRASSTMPSKRCTRSAISARFASSQRTSSRSENRAAKSRRNRVSSTGAARSTFASFASKRRSQATIHGSPIIALSSNSCAMRPLASG